MPLFILTAFSYEGNFWSYLLFTLGFNFYLFYSFREDSIFFEKFMAILFWLGFWFKFSIAYSFLNKGFGDGIGFFDFQTDSFDRVLTISVIGLSGLIIASKIRQKVFFRLLHIDSPLSFKGFEAFYNRYYQIIWPIFLLLSVTIAVTNSWIGIYQRGVSPDGDISGLVRGVYSWFLLFGGASISAFLLSFELKRKPKLGWFRPLVVLFETFLSATSMNSRAMIVNASSLGLGYWEEVKKRLVQSTRTYWVSLGGLFLLLFALSIVCVSHLRHYQGTQRKIDTKEVFKAKILKQKEASQRVQAENKNVSKAYQLKPLLNLVALRWVGVDGIIAVSAYPKKGWLLFTTAWEEKFKTVGTTFFDREIKRRVPVLSKSHHIVSMPGMMGFLFYPGSLLFLFFGMLTIGLLGAFFEYLTLQLGGGNLILASLIGQVVAYRFAHFGYVPARSYMLFGSIGLTLLIFIVLEYSSRLFHRLKLRSPQESLIN